LESRSFAYPSPAQQENIDNFLKVVEKMGVPAEDKFQTEDLFYGNNITKVLLTVFSFANAIKGQFNAPALDTSGLEVLIAFSPSHPPPE
jgi:hypothetical protein